MSIISRIDNITGLSEEYRHDLPPIPKSVKIELTAKCNFSCSFCARSKEIREQKEMNIEVFKRLLRDLKDCGVEEIGLFYLGESFMCSWLGEAIRFAKKELNFPYVFLTTNGSLCTPVRLKQCFENGLDSLKFSFNYCDAEQFQNIAGINSKVFDVLVSNIQHARPIRDKVFKETGHRCGLYASYIEYDGSQGVKMQKALELIKDSVDEIYALPLYNQADLVTEDEKARGWKPTPGNRGRSGALHDPSP